ncbi:photosystem II manganese-stabilizing protein PsbO [Stanieria cyanosphaera PCC 7437]|uniref:Photosystem II extrinsic protein O n=1 Tax=Stanieria cyanosphaera (strain ATCC 29371 / PCC 7437) TaxID=111780 RepID=K9XSZ1_STAC7|nr:photosystem II manganese-stabilizing polypeptide [Stanieria cyanosphaera]AFZ35196.1 photosystem II manganese-stabilizing protein PsbO [Stanieria cyanosphaera PCC 7437]
MRYRALIAAFLALCLGVLTACSENPKNISRDQLTYDDILNTGIANTCLDIPETSRGSISLDSSKSYTITDLCIEPKEFFVKEEPANKRQEAEFIQGKKLTRYTSSLDQISGDIILNEDGSLTFKEKDGIDFQAITVLLPGGKEVPFLFTIKNLIAKTQPNLNSINASTDFSGEFKVPSYRGQVFLDPKGRSLASGYDNAVALPARADDEDFTRANVKEFVSRKGKIALNVTKVDSSTGEIAGVFVSEQTSATDLGAEEPEEVKVRGTFYGRVQPAA